jgi:hypothetical protein
MSFTEMRVTQTEGRSDQVSREPGAVATGSNHPTRFL